MTRRRCTRGHFIPATAPTSACHCVLVPRRRRRHRFSTDVYGQGLAARQKTVRTIWPTGSYL
ncbi:hypothetical protein [Streptomyces sp. NPDC059063]|uniref:hypothetical protein n=1 Tax=unclassified Streptomyces TaxID=2593676 RepID=UPI0036AF013A